jgi:hypothetical protein
MEEENKLLKEEVAADNPLKEMFVQLCRRKTYSHQMVELLLKWL